MGVKKDRSKNPLRYFMGLIQVYTVLIVFMIFGMVKSSDIWYDEVFSVRFAQLGMSSLIKMASKDVHPPLYYIYLKICMKVFGVFGLDVIQASKLASCIPAVALLVFAIIWGRKRLNGTVTTLFAFLIVTLPCLSAYYVEIRMYSLALMFITFEYAAMTDILESQDKKLSRFVVMFCMALAAAYTQYFAGIAAAAVYIVLLIGLLVIKKDRSYLYAVIGMIVLSIILYLPWLPVFLRQLSDVSGSYWIQPMTLRSLPGCLKFMFMPQIFNTKAAYALAGLMIALCFISYILFFAKKPDKKDIILVISGPFAALLIIFVGYVFSLMGSPIFTYRYLIPVMGIICLNISRVIADRKSNAAMYFIIFFCVILGYVSFSGFYNEEVKKSNAWKEAQIILSKIEPKSAVITNFDHVMTICAYYLTDDDIYLYEDEAEAVIKDLSGGCDSIDDDGINRLLKERENVYFFGSFNVRDEIVKDWEKNGIIAEYSGECLVERYWFNIYRLSAK